MKSSKIKKLKILHRINRLKKKFVPGCLYLDKDISFDPVSGTVQGTEVLLMYEGMVLDTFRFVVVAAESDENLMNYATSTYREDLIKIYGPFFIKEITLIYVPLEDLPLYMCFSVKRPLYKELLNKIVVKS